MVQYSSQLDATFAALSDPTRRGILERLGRGDALAQRARRRVRHVADGREEARRVLERAGLVTTEKVGRVRSCRLGPRRLDDETDWIALYRQTLEARLDRLGEFLEREKGLAS